MSYNSILGFLLILISCEAHVRKTLDDYLNTCMDGINHKTKPGPEGTLFQQCTPWKKRSCCHTNITEKFHTTPLWYNFDWHHCDQLSKQCRSHFIQDLCFYECTPNAGPWIVKDSGMKIRKERYFNIPLCSTECNNWWNSCQNDSTCIENWTRGFDWSTGINTCPKNSVCKKFNEIFHSAKDFCEKVWDHSWKVVSNDESCFKIWFNEPNNPNDIIALEKAKQLISSSQTIYFEFFLLIVLLYQIYILV